jgi:hypothetical protein
MVMGMAPLNGVFPLGKRGVTGTAARSFQPFKAAAPVL